MSIITTLKRLVFPSLGSPDGGVISAPPSGLSTLTLPPGESPRTPTAGISRRTFFSFFGVGAAMLAKPDLFLAPARFVVPAGQGNIIAGTSFIPGLRKEFARTYAKIYANLCDRYTFDGLMRNCSNLGEPPKEQELTELYGYYQDAAAKDSWEVDKLVSE